MKEFALILTDEEIFALAALVNAGRDMQGNAQRQ